MTVRRIGNTTVDFAQLTIEGDASQFSVEPKVLDALERLIAHDGEVVEREALIDEVWGVSYGGDERLSRAISLLRKALGDDARNPLPEQDSWIIPIRLQSCHSAISAPAATRATSPMAW